MTEWRTPADEPGDAPASPEGSAGSDGAPGQPVQPPDGSSERPARPARPRHRRQTQLLILAGALAVAAVVLLLVVLLTGGSDGPAKGSPEATADRFAAALRSGASAQVSALACASARSGVLAGARAVLASVTSAHRSGSATTASGLAVARLVLSVRGKNEVATLALRHDAGAWCAAGFVVSAAP